MPAGFIMSVGLSLGARGTAGPAALGSGRSSGAHCALGTAVTFCAEAQGTGPFNYQWQKNGLNLPDQTNRCLALTNIVIADGASYRATVFTAAGAVESEEAVLTIGLTSLPGVD